MQYLWIALRLHQTFTMLEMTVHLMRGQIGNVRFQIVLYACKILFEKPILKADLNLGRGN